MSAKANAALKGTSSSIGFYVKTQASAIRQITKLSRFGFLAAIRF
jgi:hypothetical protein